MEILEIVANLFQYAAYAFVGGIGLLIALVVLFGKRVETKWDYEADFRDGRGREIGEFDISLKRVIEDKNAAVQPDFALKAKFVLRHPALEVGHLVCVRLAGVAVFETTVSEPGKVMLRTEDLLCDIKSPTAGQPVSVEVAGAELFNVALRPD